MTRPTLEKKLPKWALASEAVVKRCAHDVPFRMRVLSAERWQRDVLIELAERSDGGGEDGAG